MSSPFIKAVVQTDSAIAPTLSAYEPSRSAAGEQMAADAAAYIRSCKCSPDFLMVAQGLAMQGGEAVLRGFLRGIGAAIKEGKS